MQLTGHASTVQSLSFDPTGQHLASGSKDKRIFLWNVYGDCVNYGVLEGHKNAVLDVHWSSDGGMLFSCSSDKTAAVWDTEYGRRIKKFVGHSLCVNACSPLRRGPQLMATGSDDGLVKVWDARAKRCVHSLPASYPVTAVCFGGDGSRVYSGGVDDAITVWDLRKEAAVVSLAGHTDTVTYIALSPDGNHILSNAMDNTVRAWDVRPFVADAGVKVFRGATHGVQKFLHSVAWSPSGERVAAASSNGNALVWDFDSQAILYDLPGHGKGGCVQVDFHPKEPILGTCGGTDIFIGEITAV